MAGILQQQVITAVTQDNTVAYTGDYWLHTARLPEPSSQARTLDTEAYIGVLLKLLMALTATLAVSSSISSGEPLGEAQLVRLTF